MPTLPPEIIIVANDADAVSCDGGGGSLGHPVPYYSLGKSDVAECGYCDRVFVKQRAASSYKPAKKGKKAV